MSVVVFSVLSKKASTRLFLTTMGISMSSQDRYGNWVTHPMPDGEAYALVDLANSEGLFCRPESSDYRP